MMKKISILTVCIAALLTGCLKDDAPVDFGQIKPTVMLINSGLGYFSSAALIFASDTLTVPFQVNLASQDRFSKDITVELGVDDQAISDYNAKGGIQYEKMADSSYSFPTSSVTIAAGQRVVTVYVTFYKHTFDPSKSYMLPISITSADGTDLSSNFNTMYFHVIGNPLAGSYSWDFYRWNDAADTTGPPNSTVFEGEDAVGGPVDATTILLPEGYLDANGLGLGGVSIGFTNTNGVISDPYVFIDEATQKAIDDNGFQVITAPKIISYQIVGDASTHYTGSTFRVYFEIVNSSGGNRKTINNYTKK